MSITWISTSNLACGPIRGPWLLAFVFLAGCASHQAPAPVIDANPPATPVQLAAVMPPPPVPVQPPPPPIVATEIPPLEENKPPQVLEELWRLTQLAADEVRREIAMLQALVTRPKPEYKGENKAELARLKLGFLLAQPGPNQDDPRALTVLDPLISPKGREKIDKERNDRVRQMASLLYEQISERLRQVKEEQRRADALQYKLDQLKSLEKSLSGRDRRSGGPR